MSELAVLLFVIGAWLALLVGVSLIVQAVAWWLDW